MEFTIECEPRQSGVNPRKLRRMGKLPAVLYGHEGTESVSLSLPLAIAERMLTAVEVNNTLITVKVPELSLDCQSLLRDVQTHPWKSSLYHLSFFAIAGQDSVTVTVPLNFVGEPIGVKQDNGSLDLVLTSLELQCEPQSIPESIDIDISGFNIGDAIHVNELSLPKGVTSAGEGNRVVASVLAPAGATVTDDETEEGSEEAAGEPASDEASAE
ncbi:50S ribosomal protein L25 [Acaryochloris thomasi RCC1774]|uniref:Large ribosomal subunit protein bL25 n=1 Tax=Acaryochloris thomasi RCC1774 TaxID=1764569 RepID=A0A2W1JBZ2_9CYAN|nr:50S ribosomal protein L25/general stress protein Ctc [Acaryochloris thomasi]PZD71519.1 50S ribosomal protein L25 [Acaryochloris thomasi RCC1774]